MKRLACLFVCLQLLSCTNKHLSNDQLILGDWVQVKPDKNIYSDSNNPVPEDFAIPGFSFYKNHTFDNKRAYIKYIKDDLVEKMFTWVPSPGLA